MAKKIVLKLPDIPRNISPELYNYFVQLHQNFRLLEEALNKYI